MSAAANKYRAFPTSILTQDVSITGTGQQELITAVAGEVIVVVDLLLFFSGPTTVKFQSASNDLMGAIQSPSTLDRSAPMRASVGDNLGHFETNEGEAFNINLGSSVTVGGRIRYFTIPDNA